jgi:hypothetical protein
MKFLYMVIVISAVKITNAKDNIRIGLIEIGSEYKDRKRPPWFSGRSSWLQIQRSQVRFPAPPDFLRSSGSGMVSTQPCEYN